MFFHQAVHGGAYAEAQDQEGYAAHDADDGHGHALFVAEKIPRRHFVEEGQPAPQTFKVFEENPRALGRGLGHEEGRGFQLQAALHAHIGHQTCGHHADDDGDEDLHRVQGYGQLIEDAAGQIAVGNDPAQYVISQKGAGNAADECGQGAEAQILLPRGNLGISQGLVGADDHAVVVHHAVHDRGGQEHGNGKEKDREDGGKLVHPIAVVQEDEGAHFFVNGDDFVLGLFQNRQNFLGPVHILLAFDQIF